MNSFMADVVLALRGMRRHPIFSGLATREFANLLYGVAPYDPLVLIAVATLLLVIAAGASDVPARRALRIDPLIALRTE